MLKLKIERILKTSKEKQQIMYKDTPIRLSADFSAETLQARMKCHNIFKVIKGKTYNWEYFIQQYLICIWLRDQKFDRQAKSQRVQHHQTSFIRNAKPTYLSEKEKATTRNMKKLWKEKYHW